MIEKFKMGDTVNNYSTHIDWSIIGFFILEDEWYLGKNIHLSIGITTNKKTKHITYVGNDYPDRIIQTCRIVLIEKILDFSDRDYTNIEMLKYT